MNERKPYPSHAVYLAEAVQTVRDFLSLYKSYYLLTDAEGHLQRRKGQITFGTDLELSLENALEPVQKAAYEQNAEILRQRIRQMAERAAASFQNRTAIPLEYLFQVFHLGEAERFLVLLAVAPSLDRSLERAYGLFQDDYKKTLPELDLAVRLYTADDSLRYQIRSDFHSSQNPLRYFLERKEAAEREIIKISPRILQMIWNYSQADPFLAGETSLEFPGKRAVPPLAAQGELLKQAVEAAQRGTALAFYFSGPEGVGKRTMVRQMAGALSQPVLWVDLRKLSREPEMAEEKLFAVEREQMIRMAIPCFTHFEKLQEEEGDGEGTKGKKEKLRNLLFQSLSRSRGLVCLTSTQEWGETWEVEGLQRMDFPIPAPDTEQQILLWKELLAGLPKQPVEPEALGTRYSLTPGQIQEALREAEAESQRKGLSQPGEEELMSACRRRLTVHLGNQAVQVESFYTWEDLVLPDRQKDMLRQVCNQVAFQHQVYGRWGFGKKVAYGRGVSALFYGPPGTGKTMGAQVLAHELKTELYKVNLSSVMSKYIGETEKNLEKIFDGVRHTRNILFFDEADALFGKRTEVKDSHDKYANAETAYLLQKMEEYPGIVILATNYMQNFDEAFKRRLKFMIEFPFPDPVCRKQMWKQVFPPELPLGDLDYDYLAERFELSGSSIKNIAVAAAFLAVPEKRPVELADVLTALRREMEKAGKSMSPESFGEYYDLLEPSGI